MGTNADAKKDMLEIRIPVAKTLMNARTLNSIVVPKLLVSIRMVDMSVIVQKDMKKLETFALISTNASLNLVILLLLAGILKVLSLVSASKDLLEMVLNVMVGFDYVYLNIR